MEEETARKQIEYSLKATENMHLESKHPKEWEIWRQAIRDVPLQPGFPENIVWAEPPDNFVKDQAGEENAG